MVRKFLAALSVVVACSGLAACDIGSKPEDVAKAYVSASFHLEFAKAYDLLSEADRNAVSRSEFLDHPKPAPMASLEHDLNKGRFEVTSVAVTPNKDDPDKAIAKVSVAHVDTDVLMKATGRIETEGMDAWYMSEDNEKVAAQILRDQYGDRKDLPMTTDTLTVHLLKEDGRWRVFADLAGKKAERERRMKVHKLVSAYLDAEGPDNKIAAAKKVLELDPENEIAKSGLEDWQKALTSKNREKALKLTIDASPAGPNSKSEDEIIADLKKAIAIDPDNELAQDKLKEAKANKAYLSQIHVINATLAKPSGLVPKWPKVTYRLKNTGGKDVSAVYVRVSLFDNDGKLLKKVQELAYKYFPKIDGLGEQTRLKGNGMTSAQKLYLCLECGRGLKVASAKVEVAAIELSEFEK